MLGHDGRDRWDLDQLMAQGSWVLARQQGAAAAAGVRVVIHHHIHPFDRQQLRTRSKMARLSAALAATAPAALGRLKPRPIAGGWPGGVARAAADLFPQAGQLRYQGGELNAQLLNLLLLDQDERSDGGWGRQPVSF